jgi:hypothetical protein
MGFEIHLHLLRTLARWAEMFLTTRVETLDKNTQIISCGSILHPPEYLFLYYGMDAIYLISISFFTEVSRELLPIFYV